MIVGLFAKLTYNSKSNTKLTSLFFLEISFALFTPQVHIIHENAIIFFLKMTFLLSNPHYLQIITRLPLSKNTLATMNNQFEAFNAPKIDLPFFFLHSYELNTTSRWSMEER